MENLKNYIRRYCQITDDDLTKVINQFHPRQIPKNRMLLQPGQICNEFVFVETGAFRMYKLVDNKETTAWVFFEGTAFCELISFLRQIPTSYAIQALENSRIWTITHSNMEMLYRTVPSWQEFGRRHWEEALLKFTDVAQSFQSDPAETRYNRFTSDRRMLQRLSLRQLASLLGVTPYTLSRLRRKR